VPDPVLVPVPLPVLVPVPLPVLVPVPLPVLVPVPVPVLVPVPVPVLVPVPLLEPVPEWPASPDVWEGSMPETAFPPQAPNEAAETPNARSTTRRAVRMTGHEAQRMPAQLLAVLA
jgi:hypothetical protein